MKKSHKGFTVLELLIVIAIMCILMGLILVGLNAARSHSHDEDKVTNIQTVVVGLTQYYDACRSYPATLDPTTACPSLGTKMLADFIPNLASYNFNQPGSDYMYTGLTVDTTDHSDCTNFHIGVKLEADSSAFTAQKSNFNSTSAGLPHTPNIMNICSPSTSIGFDGTSTSVFDIEK